MGYLSATVILASVVYVLIRPPPWMPSSYIQWRHGSIDHLTNGSTTPQVEEKKEDKASDHATKEEAPSIAVQPAESKSQDAKLMPPPPIPTLNNTPTLVEPEEQEQTTPKAAPSAPSVAVPSFSLEEPTSRPAGKGSMPPPPKPSNDSLSMPPPPVPSAFSRPFPPSSSSSSAADKPAQGRMPTLSQFPAPNSAQRARGPTPARGPAPSRGPSNSLSPSSGLGPPPTITQKPTKPSRKILLEPGHSPLDWASISGPNADLRGLPPSTPYLRVTPSMLKLQNGRKGTDAWMAINGKVYNVTPYAKYHPGGVPELMRGAGKDGGRLFMEIHPWVNYETMLSACLVGLMVEEGEKSGMEDMD